MRLQLKRALNFHFLNDCVLQINNSRAVHKSSLVIKTKQMTGGSRWEDLN
jgi:hypothetical protein